MQRTERELTDVEIIDAFNEIVDLIVESYDAPVRKEFQSGSRAAQIGHDIVDHLHKRDVLDRLSNIGYGAQRILIGYGAIKPGKADPQQRIELEGNNGKQEK